VRARNSPEWKSHYDAAYGKRPKYELYDLKNDPHETKNLADDPAHAGIKNELEKRLLAELKRTGDPRLIDEGSYFEKAPLAGPVQEESPAGNKKNRKSKPNK
jgi:arylsulfatase A-like enzyme